MLVFLKLGGSLITDKTRKETARRDVIRRLGEEVRLALAQRADLRLLIGHGSGSFGHFAADRTRFLDRRDFDAQAYAQVGAAAARLNRIVVDRFLAAGVPVVALPPSASARCREGCLVDLATAPLRTLLEQRAVPMVHGDVALDELRGATIVSTEQVFVFLARALEPDRIVLAGNVDGVFTADPTRYPDARPISHISSETLPSLRQALGGAAGVDVTGGMLSKVQTMLELVEEMPALEVVVLSGRGPGRITTALTDPATAGGTLITATHEPSR
jgi:isopentenyl phosphate kinase